MSILGILIDDLGRAINDTTNPPESVTAKLIEVLHSLLQKYESLERRINQLEKR